MSTKVREKKDLESGKRECRGDLLENRINSRAAPANFAGASRARCHFPGVRVVDSRVAFGREDRNSFKDRAVVFAPVLARSPVREEFLMACGFPHKVLNLLAERDSGKKGDFVPRKAGSARKREDFIRREADFSLKEVPLSRRQGDSGRRKVDFNFREVPFNSQAEEVFLSHREEVLGNLRQRGDRSRSSLHHPAGRLNRSRLRNSPRLSQPDLCHGEEDFSQPCLTSSVSVSA